jgi:hypothetical protein
MTKLHRLRALPAVVLGLLALDGAATAAPPIAAGPLRLTLSNAVARGLEHNLRAVLAAQTVEAASGAREVALSGLLPTVDAAVIAFGLLFVPLTTITMDYIPREEMGNATSLFNLMRNIGGSTGIATVQTLLVRDRQVHINALGSHVDAYSPQARMMVENLRGAFIARGADSVTATRRAFAAAFGMVQKQAAMISFIDAFRLLAVIFVVILPLVLLLRRPSHQRGPVVHSGE